MEITKEHRLILEGKICPYCRIESILLDSSVVYKSSYGMIYFCPNCKSYCGCHKGTNKSLGRIANRELREMKKDAHRYFDFIWESGIMSRRDAYRKLSIYLGLPIEYTHIGMFSTETCKKVIEFSKEIINKEGTHL
ncbi:MAG: zinc-finger-containing protein [Leadbetterella sp.]